MLSCWWQQCRGQFLVQSSSPPPPHRLDSAHRYPFYSVPCSLYEATYHSEKSGNVLGCFLQFFIPYLLWLWELEGYITPTAVLSLHLAITRCQESLEKLRSVLAKGINQLWDRLHPEWKNITVKISASWMKQSLSITCLKTDGTREKSNLGLCFILVLIPRPKVWYFWCSWQTCVNCHVCRWIVCQGFPASASNIAWLCNVNDIFLVKLWKAQGYRAAVNAVISITVSFLQIFPRVNEQSWK